MLMCRPTGCLRPIKGKHLERAGPYGGSLWKSAKVTKALSPLTYGPSPRLRVPSLRSCSVGPPPSAIHGRGRLPRHPCRGAHCAEPALGLPTGQIKIKSKIKSQSQSQSKATGAVPTLIVPTLCVGMHPVTLCVTIAQDSSLASTAERGASPAAFPRGAWERSVRTGVEETGRPVGRLAVLLRYSPPREAHGAGPERGHAEPGRGTERKGQERFGYFRAFRK